MQKIVTWLGTTTGRITGWLTTLVLVALMIVTAPGAQITPAVGGVPGILGFELIGTPADAEGWLDTYGMVPVADALRGDLWFILCWSLLLALLCLWTGQNYRTVATRRLAGPFALVALGAGILDLLEDLFLALATGVLGGTSPWSPGWMLGAIASWGKWLVVLLGVFYVAGGLASLLLPGRVRTVLRTADAPSTVVASRTTEQGDYGLAFSGGGIRAASISLGALQALEEDGGSGWDQADHVTSVSGGSYMAGGWSLARSAPTGPRATGAQATTGAAGPRPWASVTFQPGPEERHLRANLGYLLSNTPRGAGADTEAHAPHEKARAQRSPAAVASVLTGLLLNVLVLLGILWVLSQPLGWFYRWYFGLGCQAWRADIALEWDAHHECLVQPDRLVPPLVGWFAVGLLFVVLWVALAKLTEVAGVASPPAWLLVPKYAGYGGLALGAALTLVLGALPFLVGVLWRPVEGHSLLTTLAAVAGALGSATAVPRILRKPLAKLAPVLGGLIFAVLLLFLLGRWALTAMVTGPPDGPANPWTVVVVLLVAVHFAGASEMWSLAAFYRSKLRSAFATYRLPYEPKLGVRVRAYGNGDSAADGQQAEPGLASLHTRGLDPAGTSLTVCAAATVTGREVRTHYGIPALSVTFSPTAVRTFWPLEEDGLWRPDECTTEEMEVLMPRPGPRLTTMLAVGLSGAAVSPAMGRFRVGPVSMLLTFANVRLGMWIPNPRYATALAAHGKRLPRPGLGYLLKEFLGFHDPSDLYLYVTDGGHWENTALVELLRTSHHRELVCVDADSGPGNLAGSISRAVDLAQLECAASIALNLDVLRSDADPTPGRDYSPRSVNLGLVRRVDGNEERLSVLWYCKPALTEDMPPKLLAYREVDPTFPRVSTVNQFFHVAQFEAYRDLGRYNARRIKAARATLAEALRGHPTLVAYRQWLAQDEPEGWVLAELTRLIDQLAADRPAAELAYSEELYASVRATLTR